jgi:acetylornithine/succinyldiaminopimelate/putrescine aminotransferase
MGGGMPIGAFIANQKVMSVFKDNPILGHITTFGDILYRRRPHWQRLI